MAGFILDQGVGIEAALRKAKTYLDRAGSETASLDARRLLTHATGLEFSAVLLAPTKPLTEEEATVFADAINRRAAREPVARILGWQEFWGLRFELNDATLVPRPDTETLVEAVLAKLKEREAHGPLRLLDLGTGSGCILLSLLSEVPAAKGVGVDLVPEAIEAARKNARSLGLEERASFAQGSWFEGVSGLFDVIVSNPPYITEAEMADLMEEVKHHDPRLALTPGGDGLAAYRQIIGDAKPYLAAGGFLALEIGHRQADDVTALCKSAGFSSVSLLQDLGGRDRVVLALN